MADKERGIRIIGNESFTKGLDGLLYGRIGSTKVDPMFYVTDKAAEILGKSYAAISLLDDIHQKITLGIWLNPTFSGRAVPLSAFPMTRTQRREAAKKYQKEMEETILPF